MNHDESPVLETRLLLIQELQLSLDIIFRLYCSVTKRRLTTKITKRNFDDQMIIILLNSCYMMLHVQPKALPAPPAPTLEQQRQGQRHLGGPGRKAGRPFLASPARGRPRPWRSRRRPFLVKKLTHSHHSPWSFLLLGQPRDCVAQGRGLLVTKVSMVFPLRHRIPWALLHLERKLGGFLDKLSLLYCQKAEKNIADFFFWKVMCIPSVLPTNGFHCTLCKYRNHMK